MARIRRLAGQTVERVTVELTRQEQNRLRSLAVALGWSHKERQVSLNTVFSFGLDAAEAWLAEDKHARVRESAQAAGA